MSFKVTGDVNGNCLTVRAEGRVDSTNAPALEGEIFTLLNANPCDKVILDAENLEYISSAGLRVVLKLKKAKPDSEIVNVSNDVYEIFEMTGFTDIIKISRRLRQFSVEGCKLIGQGGVGKIYRYDPETIIKVYRPEITMEYIERERACSQAAFKCGLPTAISFDVVRVGDCYGVMYELMDADNLASLIINHPEDEDFYVKKYAELAKMIHSISQKPDTLQPASEIFRSSMAPMSRWLTQEEIDRYDALIDIIPKRNTLIHGDYHEKNVLVRDGELEMIDMGDISQGHPMVELACAYCSHAVFSDRVIGIPRDRAMKIWDKFCRYYFGEIDENVKPSFNRLLTWIAALRRLPFLCMSSFSTKELIDSVKAEVFVDTELVKADFAIVDKALFPEV
ncbi:MAG: anti-sigma factor antagonist [Candidatus Coproplasma sp.]